MRRVFLLSDLLDEPAYALVTIYGTDGLRRITTSAAAGDAFKIRKSISKSLPNQLGKW